MEKVRIHFVDSLRGIAVITMIIFHTAFILNYFNVASLDPHSGIWLIFARFTQFTFISLVGFSLYLSFRSRKPVVFLKKQFTRAFKLILISVGVSAVTYIFVNDEFVRFGILHFIALGIIIGALLIPFRKICISMIVIPLISGAVTSQINIDTVFLLPFGIIPTYFATLDYFPLFPWLSLLFFGIEMGRILDSYKLLKNPAMPRFHILESLGQNALLIYLIHLPLLYGIIYLINIK